MTVARPASCSAGEEGYFGGLEAAEAKLAGHSASVRSRCFALLVLGTSDKISLLIIDFVLNEEEEFLPNRHFIILVNAFCCHSLAGIAGSNPS